MHAGCPEGKGKTYNNNRALTELKIRYPERIKTEQMEIEIKNVGRCRANLYEHLAKPDAIDKPSWIKDITAKEQKDQEET